MATIICQDCGDARTGCPKNTRYCKRCRLLNDLPYWRVLTRSCKSCHRDYAPLHRNDYHCSRCNPGLPQYSGPCRLAPRDQPHDAPPAVMGVPICAACCRNPATRARLIGALAQGRAQRRKANDWKEHDAG